MSQAGLARLTSGSMPPSVLLTITGNDGVPESPIANNMNILTANTTLKFTGTAGTETLNFGFSNLLLGTSGANISGAARNIGMGQNVLGNLTSGSDNVAFGAGGTGVFLTSGSNNTLIGGLAGENIATGSNNTLLGKTAGIAYTTSESDNIAINNNGVVGDSAIMRIGTQGTIAKAFIAGITGKTVAGNLTNISSTGQLGEVVGGSSGTLLQSAGAGVSPIYTSATYPASAGTIGNVLTSDGTNFLSSSPPGVGLLAISGALTNAQIKALHATPVQVIAAPGAGKVIQVISCLGSMQYGGNNVFVAGAGQNISLQYSTAVSMGVIVANAQIVASASTISSEFPLVAASTFASATNAAVNIWNSSATEISGNAANDNTIAYNIVYRIISIP